MKRLILCAMITLPLLVGGCRTQPSGGTFHRLSFDRERHFIMAESLSKLPLSGSYYSYIRGSFIDMVTHFQKGEASPAQIALLLNTGNDRKLLQTLRRERVLRGPYGIVSLEKTCFFVPPQSGYNSYLDVSSYMDARYDDDVPALTLKEIPQASLLTSVSLIKIFVDGPDYVVASGNYEAAGQLGSQNLIRVKPGGALISGQSQMIAGSKRYGLPDMSAYGMPDHLTLTEPLNRKQIGPQSPTANEVSISVVLRYDFDRYLRVDTFRRTEHADPIIVAPVVLPEDKGLNEECDENLGRQAERGTTVVR
jgi:hypothetical protein